MSRRRSSVLWGALFAGASFGPAMAGSAPAPAPAPVSAQYDTTPVYVAPENFDRFVASLAVW
jgi:hypothetical protein